MRSPREHGPIDPARASAPGGWTLLELTVAGGLLLVGLLAVVPLFVRAVRDVARGAAASRAAELSQDRLERLARPLPASVAISTEFFTLEDRLWSSEPPVPPDRALWVREGAVGHLALAALEDGWIDPAEPSDAGFAEADLVLVEIEVRGGRAAEVHALVARLERPRR